MGRGVSSGGGQSSLGYLFGDDAPSKPKVAPPAPAAAPHHHHHNEPAPPAAAPPPPAAADAAAAGACRQAPPKSEESGDSGVVKLGRNNNNYHRADGQNTGNFITDRPSTKVHSAPGGGSSLGYLFGGN